MRTFKVSPSILQTPLRLVWFQCRFRACPTRTWVRLRAPADPGSMRQGPTHNLHLGSALAFCPNPEDSRIYHTGKHAAFSGCERRCCEWELSTFWFPNILFFMFCKFFFSQKCQTIYANVQTVKLSSNFSLVILVGNTEFDTFHLRFLSPFDRLQHFTQTTTSTFHFFHHTVTLVNITTCVWQNLWLVVTRFERNQINQLALIMLFIATALSLGHFALLDPVVTNDCL